MKLLFWMSMIIMAYTYGGYPVWMYLRSRWCARSWLQVNIEPSVTIILAVHNGAPLLRQKLDHLLTLDYPGDRTEIVVVSDGSTDGTNAILEAFRHPRIRSIVCPEHQGKAAALNAGMAEAKGDILLFVDIRPWLEIKAMRLLLSNFADPRVGCATGELVLRNDGHDAGTAAVGSLYWRYEQWIRVCEAKVDSPMGVYGGFYAVRRTLACPLPAHTILDDMLQPLNVTRQGYRSVLDERAKVFDAWPRTAQGEFNRKVRTLAGNFQLLQLAPWVLTAENRLRWRLVSHKLLRLVVPALLLVTLLASYLLRAAPIYRWMWIAQLLFYAIAAFGLIWDIPVLRRVTGAASAFVLLNAAAMLGLFKFLALRQNLWRIWVKPPGVSTSMPGIHEDGTVFQSSASPVDGRGRDQ